MTRVLYFDCFAGAAGDMILGALLDAGVPLEELCAALGSLGVGHDLKVSRVVRAGINATHVEVVERPGTPGREHGHEDHHHQHGHAPGHDHRSLDEIAHLIEASNLSAAGKARAVALFRRLGEAEAAIHGVPLDQVHLHEVGAVDSIIDIVGAVWALEWLGVDEVVSSPLNVGSGMVKMAHGTFPVPAPATLRLLTGAPVYSSGIAAELLTPTGALVVTDYAGSYGAMPAMTVERIGYGAGTRQLDPVPNVLRVVIGDRQAATGPADEGGDIIRIECEIDDMNPQWFGPLSDRLFAAGALDVFLTPVQMKKGRPGTLVTVLAPPALRSRLADLLFAETTTTGLRWDRVHREILERRHEAVAVPDGEVRVKVALRHGRVLTAAPEFDDCLRIAEATGRPVREVHAAALDAWRAGRRPDRSE